MSEWTEFKKKSGGKIPDPVVSVPEGEGYGFSISKGTPGRVIRIVIW